MPEPRPALGLTRQEFKQKPIITPQHGIQVVSKMHIWKGRQEGAEEDKKGVPTQGICVHLILGAKN